MPTPMTRIVDDMTAIITVMKRAGGPGATQGEQTLFGALELLAHDVALLAKHMENIQQKGSTLP